VLIPEHRAAGITAAVARASAGAVDHVPVARVVNLPRALDELKGAGVWVYGLDATAGGVPYDEADYARPLALVAGAEGKGLSRLVRERCDLLLRIPLHGHVASLNVSVATSLALFAARGARAGTGPPAGPPAGAAAGQQPGKAKVDRR
jgi:23S rRNA (guanosine2251-2'-O)-methyltransferase